jgi:hypothetical protein
MLEALVKQAMAAPLVVRFEWVPLVVPLLAVPPVPVAMQAVVALPVQGSQVPLEVVRLVPGFPQEFAGLPVVVTQRNQIRKRLSKFASPLLASFREVR